MAASSISASIVSAVAPGSAAARPPRAFASVGTHDSRTLRALELQGVSSPKKAPFHHLLDERVTTVATPHTLYTPILRPYSDAPVKAPAGAVVVKEMIQEDVEAFTPRVDYNGLNVVTQFMDFVRVTKIASEKMGVPALSETEAFLRFTVDSARDILTRSGSACSGQTIHLMRSIHAKHGLQTYEVVERNSPTASPYHALGAIFCDDGVVLIDPSFHARDHKAIVVRPGEVTVATNIYGGRMEFRMKPGFKIIEKTSYTPTGPKTSEIVLAPLLNPDECVMKQFMLNRPWYAITGCDERGTVVSVLRVDIGQERLIFQKGTGAAAIKLSIPFAAFNLETQEFDLEKIPVGDRERLLSMGDDFFRFFKISKRDLFAQISILMRNKSVIQNLYRQTRAPQTPAPV